MIAAASSMRLRPATQGKLAVYERQMLASPYQQTSLTDPDSRSMATSGRGSGVVGYNAQVAVDSLNARRRSSLI